MNLTISVTTAGRERRFEYLCHEPYRTHDGKDIELSIWRGSCVVCGGKFWVRAPDGMDADDTNAFAVTTCREHRGMGRIKQARKKRKKS